MSLTQLESVVAPPSVQQCFGSRTVWHTSPASSSVETTVAGLGLAPAAGLEAAAGALRSRTQQAPAGASALGRQAPAGALTAREPSHATHLIDVGAKKYLQCKIEL